MKDNQLKAGNARPANVSGDVRGGKRRPPDPPWWWMVFVAWALNTYGDNIFRFLGAILRSMWDLEMQQPQSLVQTVAVTCGMSIFS